MSGLSSSREQILDSLRHYTQLLSLRKDAMSELSRTSGQMLSALNTGQAVDIDGILTKRQEDCLRVAAACRQATSVEPTLLDAAKRAAEATNDELGRLARSVLALEADTNVLGQEILHCQAECETILKARLSATTQAIHESSQRRKLDAAYGPACKHGEPAFLDKQQ